MPLNENYRLAKLLNCKMSITSLMCCIYSNMVIDSIL